MKIKSAIYIVALTAIVFTACKSSTDNKAEATDNDKISQEDVKKSVEEVLFPLPEPMGVYEMLQNIGAPYVGSNLNPVNSADKYFTPNNKSIGLGIYAADLSYALVNNKQDDIDSYAKVLKKLIDELGINVDYKVFMDEDSKPKVTESDTLAKLATDIFYDTYEFLYNESDPALAALMANGYYIEALYLATHISQETFNNIKMVEIIYGQAKPLEELIKLNDKFSENEQIKSIQGALKKLKELYDQTDGSLNEEQLKSITSTVEQIRLSLIA